MNIPQQNAIHTVVILLFSFIFALSSSTITACSRKNIPPVVSPPQNDPPTVDLPLAHIPGVRGMMKMPYKEQEGWAVAEGDIVLGPVEDVRNMTEKGSQSSVLFGLAGNPVAILWPDGVIPFEITSDFLSDEVPNPMGFPTAGDVRNAIRIYEERTPLRFVNHTNEFHWVSFRSSGPFANSSPVGRQYYGAQAISISIGPNRTGLLVQRSLLHEIGHTAGLFHEHNRPDRDASISVDWGCVDPLFAHQFLISPWGDPIGPYDLASIMHYSSQSFLLNNGTCTASITTPDGGIINTSFNLTSQDVNTLWKLYSRFDADAEDGDQFGHAVATADFDGDGFDDLAVGAPFDRTDEVDQAGAVYLFKGTDAIPVPWLKLSLPLEHPVQTNDKLGFSLTVGDFNNDGIPDLAAGAIGRNGHNGAVAVYYFSGTGNQLRMAQFITPDSPIVGLTPQSPGIVFGAALASGDVNGDGFDDLLIGSPGAKFPSSDIHSGGVELLRGTNLGLQTGIPMWELGFPSTAENQDGFGKSVATADLNNDGRADIIVGAPSDRNSSGQRSGAVYLFGGSATGPQPWQRLAAPNSVNSSEARFGAAVAAGDFNGDLRPDPIIGAPGATVGGVAQAGLLFIYNTGESTSGTPGTVVLADQLDQSAMDSNNPGDHFGGTILMSDLDGDGDMDLAVGAPGESVDDNAFRSGRLYLYRNAVAGLQPWFSASQPQGTQGAQFGTAIASGNFRGSGISELFVFAPGGALSPVHTENPGMGYRVAGIPLNATGDELEPDTLIHQMRYWRLEDG